MHYRLTSTTTEAALLLKPRPPQVRNVAPDNEADSKVYEQSVVQAGEEAAHNTLEEAFQNVIAHPEDLRGIQFAPEKEASPRLNYGED